MVKKRLDYLLVPNSGGWIKRKRNRAAEKVLKKRVVGEVMILNGRDSEEDILYLGKILKGGERIGIVTFPLHFEEYLELIRKAMRDKKFPSGVEVENIKISQGVRLIIYGILGLMEEKLKTRELTYFRSRHEKLLNELKGIVHEVV